jgi:hypothetical protein|eukprot:COSAG03_NODE_922_length_5300_cov_1.722938_4_plen_87_part_00
MWQNISRCVTEPVCGGQSTRSLVLHVDVVINCFCIRIGAIPVHAHALLRLLGACTPLTPANQATHALADDLSEHTALVYPIGSMQG